MTEDGLVQKDIGRAHFGGYPPFAVERLKSGLEIIVDSTGRNAMGFSRVSNGGAFIPIGDLESIASDLNS